MAANLKGNERISLQIAGNGPLGNIAADAWFLDEDTIGARGYARNGQVELPIDERGKFNVAAAVGKGSLQVTRSSEVGQPYVGVVPLATGEIAEDIAVYLAQSEQIPSIVALGVLANPNGVIAAGGVIAQALPGADEHLLAALEERAVAMPPVTQQIANGADAEALLRAIAGETELRAFRTIDVRFACRCNRSKVEAVLLGLGADELLAPHPRTRSHRSNLRILQNRIHLYRRGGAGALRTRGLTSPCHPERSERTERSRRAALRFASLRSG